jgi:hypothetical protein
MQTPNLTPILTIRLFKMKNYSNVNKLAESTHLTDDNWHVWKDQMKIIFLSCNINNYVTGTIKHPDEQTGGEGAKNWDRNNNWAKLVIMHNMSGPLWLKEDFQGHVFRSYCHT